MHKYTFEWLGSHGIVDFINTLDERRSLTPYERLGSYEALIAFAIQAHLLDDRTQTRLNAHADTATAKRVWSRAVRLREALFAVFEAIRVGEVPPQTAVGTIEREIQRATAARQLHAHGSGLTWSWRDPLAPERPLWELVLAAEALLVSERVTRLKQCEAPDCGVLFIDESRARSRRWCSMQGCGNRQKIQRFRSVHKGSLS